MALGAVHSWLITYDIADRKRLGRLHRFVKKHAIPVQYSVYATQQSVAGIGRLASDLRAYIKAQEDDPRMPAILEDGEAWEAWLGERSAETGDVKAVLKTMEGVNWTTAPEPKKPKPQ